MKNKFFAVALACLMVFAFSVPSSYAVGAKQATASLLLPTTGQAMNGEINKTKTKVMAGIEVAAITTVAILGGVVGGGVVWAGLGPLIANHIWSGTDAYHGAQNQDSGMLQNQMLEAQKTLEFSRQRRFEREQARRVGLRERVQMAGEAGYNA